VPSIASSAPAVVLVVQVGGPPGPVVRQLQAIASSSTTEPRFEVAALLESARPSLAAAVHASGLDVRVIAAGTEFGLAPALWDAVADVSAPYIAWLSPGVLPQPGWLAGLLAAAAAAPGPAVVVGARAVGPDERIVRSGLAFDHHGDPVEFGRRHRPDQWSLGVPFTPFQAVGMDAVLLSKPALSAAPLDLADLRSQVAFAAYCLRARAAGVAVIQSEQAVVVLDTPASLPVVLGWGDVVRPSPWEADAWARERYALLRLACAGHLNILGHYAYGPFERFLRAYFYREILAGSTPVDGASPPNEAVAPAAPRGTGPPSPHAPIIVLGPHRSGSSLVAEMLSKLGVHLGDTLLGPHEQNAHGYFEDVVWLQLHDQMLQIMGQSWYNPFAGAHPAFRERFGLLVEVIAELKAARARGLGKPCWGFKDPRTVVFADWYREALPNARYVVTRRAVADSAKSIARAHPEISPGMAQLAATWYAGEVERFLAQPPGDAIVVDYEACLQDPMHTARALTRWLGASVDPALAGAVVDPALARFRSCASSESEAPAVHAAPVPA